MKAILYNKKALPGKLVPGEVEMPVPGDNEILVKVFSVSVNAADYRSMKMGFIPKKKIFGADIAGRVESVGKNTRQFKPGEEVVGDLGDYGFGGLAEYALAPERLLARKPSEISFEEAAAMPLAAGTALQALRDKGQIKKGYDVLIIGSSGGVGTFAVQLAKHFGAIVTAVCSTRNIDQAKALGADNVIDYTKEDFIRDGKNYDIILVVNGDYPLLACRKKLKPGGVYVMAGGSLQQIFKSIFLGWALSLGSKKIRFLAAKGNQSDLEIIMTLAKEGRIKPVIESSFPFVKAAEAFALVSEGHAKGKIVINIQ